MSRAKYLLENYPALWAQARGEVEDALEGNRGPGFVEVNRDQGGHSDSTAARAAKLLEANILAGDLNRVRMWIDTRLPPEDRPLLLAVWRARNLGWWWVARELRREMARCVDRWNQLCNDLQEFLDR